MPATSGWDSAKTPAGTASAIAAVIPTASAATIAAARRARREIRDMFIPAFRADCDHRPPACGELPSVVRATTDFVKCDTYGSMPGMTDSWTTPRHPSTRHDRVCASQHSRGCSSRHWLARRWSAERSGWQPDHTRSSLACGAASSFERGPLRSTATRVTSGRSSQRRVCNRPYDRSTRRPRLSPRSLQIATSPGTRSGSRMDAGMPMRTMISPFLERRQASARKDMRTGTSSGF